MPSDRIIYDHPPGFSPGIFFGLAFICGISGLVLWILIRRWTSHRHWISLGEWGREHGFKRRPLAPEQMPAPIAALSPLVRLCLTGRQATLVQLQIGETSCNLLFQKTRAAWIVSSLRPSSQIDSVMDRLGMTSYPAYSNAERFHVLSADASAARKLARNSARALLPADVGLLLAGEWLVLDFTMRPFDPIEFARMLSVAEQVARAIET